MKGREGNGRTGERIKAAARKREREIIAGVKKTSRVRDCTEEGDGNRL